MKERICHWGVTATTPTLSKGKLLNCLLLLIRWPWCFPFRSGGSCNSHLAVDSIWTAYIHWLIDHAWRWHPTCFSIWFMTTCILEINVLMGFKLNCLRYNFFFKWFCNAPLFGGFKLNCLLSLIIGPWCSIYFDNFL